MIRCFKNDKIYECKSFFTFNYLMLYNKLIKVTKDVKKKKKILY